MIDLLFFVLLLLNHLSTKYQQIQCIVNIFSIATKGTILDNADVFLDALNAKEKQSKTML